MIGICRLLAVPFLLAVVSCRSAPTPQEITVRLASAKAGGLKTTALVESVLDDVLLHRYEFDADERRAALEAVKRLNLIRAVPAVRGIAALALTGPENHMYADVVAVMGRARDLTAGFYLGQSCSRCRSIASDSKSLAARHA